MKEQEKTKDQLISEVEELRHEKHERKRAEEALRESEERFSLFMDYLPAIVFLKDENSRILYVNEHMNDVLGAKEWIGKSFLERLPKDTAKAMLADDKKALAEGHRMIIETVPDKHGTNHIYQTQKFRIKRFGKPPLLGGIALDITEQKKAEEALKKERNFAQSLVGTAQAIVLVLDIKGRIVSFNPYMQELSGYCLEEVKGKDWFTTFLAKTDYDHVRKLFKKAVGDIQTKGNINRIVSKSGREITIEWYDKTLKDNEGNIVGLLAIGQDITERKRAEEALRESEYRFRSFVEQSLEGITIINKQGIIVEWNRAQEKITGVNRKDVLGTPAWDFQFQMMPPDLKTPEMHRQLKTGFLKAIEGEDTTWEGQLLDQEIQSADGISRTIQTVSFRIVVAGETMIGVIMCDITEHKRAEEERKKLISDLQAALVEIKTLSGIIPICAKCKKIRDDKGYWEQVEVYIRDRTEAEFSHGLCPGCMAEEEKKIDQIE